MSEPKIIRTKPAERLQRAVAEIADVTGLAAERIMRAIGLEFFGAIATKDKEPK